MMPVAESALRNLAQWHREEAGGDPTSAHLAFAAVCDEAARCISDSASKWIPVGEATPRPVEGEVGKEPESSANVLVYFGLPDGDGTISIASYYDSERAWDIFTGFSEYEPAHPDPTHWMPLPEPPK